ncbi:HEAT repeat domain-containing protein [Inmirania thermothiophila]|uniref:non-specific serine/threonine protein kinase n=1 Tax=Inmirania thermothiophila TaxID=1750597 RepID=A0A3N1Y0W2_9GAMM|nr:HEAT repeat domain-containing protein [Inmirania thermothiophila]ROR32158.1 serine/threonine-protein kinase [Inmirania thermothiophila]
MGLLDGLRTRKAVATVAASPSPSTPRVAEAVLRLKQVPEAAVEALLEALDGAAHPETVLAVLNTFLDNATLPRFLEALAGGGRAGDAVARLLAQSRRYDPSLLLPAYLDPAIPKAPLARILEAQRERLDARGLVRLLAQAPEEGRAAVLRLLEAVASPSMVPELARLCAARDPAIRLAAARILRRFSGEAVRDALLPLLQDEHKAIRNAALEGLARQKVPVDVAPICALLRDPDLTVQSKAIETLGRIRSPETIQHLLPILQDDSEYVRRAAVEVLNLVGDTRAVKDLLNALRDQDWWVRVRAADALGTIGGPKVVEAVLALIRDEDEFIRRLAVEILNTTKDPRAAERLVAALDDPDWWVRERAVDALASLGDTRAVPSLLRLLERDRRARPVVIRALAALGDRRAVPALMRCLKDEDRAVRKEALRALARLADGEHAPEIEAAAAPLREAADEEIRQLADQTVATLQALVSVAREEPTRVAEGGGERPAGAADGPRSLLVQGVEPPAREPPIDPATLEAGSVLGGRYKVVRRVGRGAFGTVVLVEDQAIEDRIVLKILNPQVTANADVVKRFVLELKYARRIAHENVIRIYDFVAIGGSYAMSMEYFESHSLAAELRGAKPLDIARGVRIALQICRGMAVTHRGNLVHRDLKPSNILIGEGDLVKIVDFGLAAAAREGETHLTRTGVILGTPSYMAPEQIRGHRVDPRTDIYSLGVVMYEMFTGRPPYVADDPMAILFKHLEGEPEPPSRANPAVPPALEHVVLKAMARRPEDRYDTMDSLGRALERVLARVEAGA